jgi:hypothetical protein
MRIRLGRVTVKTAKNTGRSEMRREEASNREMLEAVPRLKREGLVQFGGLEVLATQGWTADEVNQVIDAFPDTAYRSLTLVVSLAGAIRQHGVAEVDDIIAWLRAIFEVRPNHPVVARRVVREEVARARQRGDRSGMPAVPKMWAEAAGSPQAGLAAIRAGLTLAETTAQNRG